VSAAEVSRSSCARASLSPATRRADGYARRRPEETLLYRVVAEHWPSFRDNAGEQGGLPRFVVRELDDYLGCGLLERGLVHLACSRCGQSMVVAFSCKRRGFCPSCTGRRSADVAAHMVDEVFPEVPIRQWVCSFPWSLRTPLGYDRALRIPVGPRNKKHPIGLLGSRRPTRPRRTALLTAATAWAPASRPAGSRWRASGSTGPRACTKRVRGEVSADTRGGGSASFRRHSAI
jgi:hypothetical protein